MTDFDQIIKIPLVEPIGTRNSTFLQDCRLVNAYAEKMVEEEGWVVEQRFGYTASSFNVTAGAGRGAYNWNGDVYEIVGTTFYKNGVNKGTVDGTNGVYYFQIIRGTPGSLVMGNGVKAYYWNNTILTQITDVNFPTTFVKGWAYLDGTLYVMDSRANIWGSKNLDDPSTWDALNVIIARIEPDGGVALAKQQTYVVALKQWTTEVFYDAGNATGSPLGSVQGAKQPIGCASANSVQTIDDMLIWVTASQALAPQVVLMQNLQMQVVSTGPIDRLLSGADLTNMYSFIMKHVGHTLYVVSFPGDNFTLVYDLSQKLWYQWTDANGNYWPFVASTYNTAGRYLLHVSNGSMYSWDTDYTFSSDNGAVIPVDIYTPNYTGGTRRRKMVSALYVTGDLQVGSDLKVRYSDDDFNSWSNFQNIDLGVSRPVLFDASTFTRRAYHFRNESLTPFRLESIGLQIALGSL